jgi:hypothetical protein
MARRLDFWGANADAYNSRHSEILLAGPAGTGKSYVLLAKCLTLLDAFPGCRILFCRGTRTSLTQSGLVTWEEKVLGKGHRVLTTRPVLRRVRQSYEFPNGSELVVAGLDDPGKTLSSEYDAVYIQEATEEGVTLDVYETLLRALRNGKTPWTQVMMDCNPTTPTHWLYRRQANGGPLTLFSSTHRDNPAFWDRRANAWTPAGRAYLDNLGRMTGPRRKRFLEGIWAAAEGLVYDGYDPAKHLLPAGWEPPATWRRVWGIDWGFVQPLVVQFWAIDPDNRMHLYREIYRTKTRVEAVAKECAALVASGEEPPPSAVLADHDPECIETFRAHGRGERDGAPFSLPVREADKRDRDKGIQLVQGLFDVRPDGKPRIFFRPDARRHRPDPELESAGKPTGTLDELVGYTWQQPKPDSAKDEPIAHNDHAMDAARYVAVHVNNARPMFAAPVVVPY